MLCLEDKVNRLGEKSPTGIIKKINQDSTATVLWGVSDGIEYSEVIELAKLKHANI